MFRKLIFLALVGAGVAYVMRQRSEAGQLVETTPAPAPSPEAEAAATAVTTESDAVVPDTSAGDPLVQEQEDAAAEEAAAIGGEPDTVTAEVSEEMRPVVEGSGDSEETLEKGVEEEGR
jgi:predicted membrane-bound mannosyltransferase